MIRRFGTPAVLGAGVLSLWLCSGVPAQAADKRNLITDGIDNAKRTRLAGNTRPEVTEGKDLGLVADDTPMEHMMLLLKRSPEQEAELQSFIDDLHNPKSPNFHKWITAEQYGDKFGLSQQDLDAVSHWLSAQGFAVNVVYSNGGFIDFSGTAGTVRKAFGTEIHSLDVDGVRHIANMSDPTIPAALAAAVHGIVSLHDFRPHAMKKESIPRTTYTFTSGATFEAIVPADLWTIYNFSPAFSAGFTGQGQSIVLIEDTFLYSISDWTVFRKEFGMSRTFPFGTLTQVAPAPKTGTNNCGAPGVNSDDGEAAIDVEYASAAAPNAALILAACADVGTTTFGGLIALQNLLSEGTPAKIVSISYGDAEASNGATSNAAFNNTYAQAVTAGISVFVSSGDEGAASADANKNQSTHGIGVSGWGSTPNNISVGGTDFGDTFNGTNSTYWNATNSPNFSSVKSYVPEIPWNDSCASQLLETFLAAHSGTGTTNTYGPSGTGLCNTSPYDKAFNATTNPNGLLTTASGSGGPSGCATGAPATSGVVGGTCKGYAKPSWQLGLFGNPGDTVRDIPDVALFASNGSWGHYYVVCYSDPANGGVPCTGAPSDWAGFGGTSVSTPIMAGIQALINQATNTSWGNANTMYYSLAKTEYGASGNASCNSSLGNGIGSTCIFNDVTQGDMDIPCATPFRSCYRETGLTHGVLSTTAFVNTSTPPSIAYGTSTGWDFATGIGSVNAWNLLQAFVKSLP